LGKNNLVAGVNVSGSSFTATQPAQTPVSPYSLFTTGVFGQYNWQFAESGTLETGLRLDKAGSNSFFALPRIAAFYRFNEQWGARGGFGMGYKMPDPLDLLNNDTARTSLLVMNTDLNPEFSYGYNAEVNYKRSWGENTLFINEALFRTDVQNPVYDQVAGGSSMLVNLATPTTTQGSDTYMKLTVKKWEFYLGYTYTAATNTFYTATGGRIPLTAKNRMAFVLTKEIEKKWKFGVEGSWFGPQYRDDGTQTPSYFITAVMICRNLGEHFTLVLNGENLLDYRMSNVESLYTGTAMSPVFKPLWAPIDGRVINFSVRWKLK
jgi:iron complex outermembrane receptor protein/outer membrane receptor for ferrienterochelin and colicins